MGRASFFNTPHWWSVASGPTEWVFLWPSWGWVDELPVRKLVARRFLKIMLLVHVSCYFTLFLNLLFKLIWYSVLKWNPRQFSSRDWELALVFRGTTGNSLFDYLTERRAGGNQTHHRRAQGYTRYSCHLQTSLHIFYRHDRLVLLIRAFNLKNLDFLYIDTFIFKPVRSVMFLFWNGNYCIMIRCYFQYLCYRSIHHKAL